MALQLPKFFWLPILVALQYLLATPVQAAPQLDLRQQDRVSLSTDVRGVWQTAMVPTNKAAARKPLDAQAIWLLPDSQFQPGQNKPMTVKDNERLVNRLSILVGDSPHGLLVELPMPRLDLAHFSYRYNNDPWTQATAGDQWAMATWPFANRHPVFVIPPKTGELQIVLDIPVPGLFPSPVVLWGDPAFRAEHSIRNLEAGSALALAFISLFFCIVPPSFSSALLL